ncbi:MAG: NAD(P)H-dependent oxidoreductase [Phycisphaerales bacterium]|nr:NAD(P)H-dependent oxidoreductase [Phycisphaerales bacterium]
MPHTPRILTFSGSLRSSSWNHQIAMVAAAAAAEAGAEITVLKLSDHPLPLFDQDLEDQDGLPQEARTLKQLFREHDGFIIGSPEYNSSISAALKNTIDWVTRPEEGYPPLDGFKGKVAGLLSCSPGRLGGMRGLTPLRTILSSIGVTVVPTQAAIPHIHECLSSGTFNDEAVHASVEGVGRAVADVAHRMLS